MNSDRSDAFNAGVCKHFSKYLKLYGNNRDASKVITRVSYFCYDGRQYILYERGDFGWWKNEGRVMFVVCNDDGDNEDDRVMFYNYDTETVSVRKDVADVYSIWFEKVNNWLNENDERDENALFELGYKGLVEYRCEKDNEMDIDENDGENNDNDEDGGENSEEPEDMMTEMFNYYSEHEIFGKVLLFMAIYFYLVVIIGYLSRIMGGFGNSCVTSFDVAGLGRTDEFSYFCDNDNTCYLLLEFNDLD